MTRASRPLAQRVPDPVDSSKDLTGYVSSTDVGGSQAHLIPQGTVGTIYYTGDDKSTAPEEGS